MKDYQVTLTSTTGKYRPVSCIIKAEGVDLTNPTDLRILVNKGTQKIALQRMWGKADLVKYGYTKAKIREYDKEKIEKQNKEKYEKIKEEKYASGEWKRPKKER